MGPLLNASEFDSRVQVSGAMLVGSWQVSRGLSTLEEAEKLIKQLGLTGLTLPVRPFERFQSLLDKD